MIDYFETLVAARQLMIEEIQTSARFDHERARYEMHPETIDELRRSLPKAFQPPLGLQVFEIDGIKVLPSLSVRRGRIRFITGARETDVVRVEPGFSDETYSRRKPTW